MIALMRYLFFLFSFPIFIISDVLELELEGVIGAERFVIISLDTIENTIDSWNPPLENTFFLGATELNIFNNQGAGSVQITNTQYDGVNSIFCAQLSGGAPTDQIKLLLKIDRNTSGTIISSTNLSSLANPVVIRSVAGNIQNEQTTIEFYLQHHPSNVIKGGSYVANFIFAWAD